jgi:hypothetical protein
MGLPPPRLAALGGSNNARHAGSNTLPATAKMCIILNGRAQSLRVLQLAYRRIRCDVLLPKLDLAQIQHMQSALAVYCPPFGLPELPQPNQSYLILLRHVHADNYEAYKKALSQLHFFSISDLRSSRAQWRR